MEFSTLVFYLFSISFSSAVALQCYECVGETNKNLPCEVAVNQVNAHNCTVGFQCLTSIVTTGNTSIINRYCSPNTTCSVLQANSTEYNTFALPTLQSTVEVCKLCDTDLCNSASFASYSPLLVLVFSGLFSYMFLV